ncbi:GIY-YIG nuclease family protein [Pseudovibrio sp. Tun.PSC04-5.I4]|uniref:GIY-YIG nuclease family protein n=1 Tax=Pseudovibrio sp. Tun.PSC04-5.I4 TaxID=1798213 RepID=UPI000881A30D|nr:GIY-YIG nuclease family protein [Pseudovibrio sp. Tun.PSC04-5.I4]SDR27430.1 putative endonuclease [Pseudovibrio sp. Tun.PSC04-5.I4]
MAFYVYILASKRNGTLYTGVTNNLARRVYEHREKVTVSFTARYGVSMLVYYEEYERVVEAIAREKVVKRWRRAWKLDLIEGLNPTWRDLYLELA